jgi:hypothetical protein
LYLFCFLFFSVASWQFLQQHIRVYVRGQNSSSNQNHDPQNFLQRGINHINKIGKMTDPTHYWMMNKNRIGQGLWFVFVHLTQGDVMSWLCICLLLWSSVLSSIVTHNNQQFSNHNCGLAVRAVTIRLPSYLVWFTIQEWVTIQFIMIWYISWIWI